jgi:hypothetical protein
MTDMYIQFFFLKISLWVLSRFLNPESVQWYESVIHGFNFIEESVLQVPFFLMTLMRYMVPTLDNLYASLTPRFSRSPKNI